MAPVEELIGQDKTGRPFLRLPGDDYGIDINLERPIFAEGTTTTRVRVRLPGPEAFKKRPRRLSIEVFNLSVIIGVTPAVAARISVNDFRRVMAAWAVLEDGARRTTEAVAACATSAAP